MRSVAILQAVEEVTHVTIRDAKPVSPMFRGDGLLLDAAEQLADGHAENDAERMAFVRSGAQRKRLGDSMGETRAGGGSELLLTAVTSKTRVRDGRREG